MSHPPTPSERARLRQVEREETKALHLLFNIASMLTEPGAFTALATRMLEEVSTVLEVDSADLRMPSTYRRASGKRTFGRFPPDPDDVLRGHGHSAERLEDVDRRLPTRCPSAASCPWAPRAAARRLSLPHHNELGGGSTLARRE